jgi:serine/threonine-protein kinase
MNSKSWQTVEAIVDQAMELPEYERKTFINQQCAGDTELKSKVYELWDSINKSEGFLEGTLSYHDELLADFNNEIENIDSESSLIGENIGAYKITKLLGHGGMGSVFLAERTDGSFDHKVALKLVRRGMDTPDNIARFQRERSILANLNHPNIGCLYDGGVTDNGLPFLIMEYIDGMPLDDYCKHHNCTFSERLQLLHTVCQTVQYAHNNLIIHRDLKSENILVTENGTVKILDFGIAKLLKPEAEPMLFETDAGGRILTLGYAAPEQINSEPVTPATDIYTLGGLFYTILTGCHPFDLKEKSITEIENIICNTSPLKPSKKVEKWSKALQGDVDAIILKSLRKDPQMRYNSAGELAEEIERFNNGFPVTAHDDTIQYNVSKFIKRHKQQLAVTAGILLLLISFAGFYVWQITEERNQAKIEAEKAKNISNFMMGLFEANNPAEALGDTVRATQLLERGVKRAEQLGNQPKVQAQLFDVVGQVHRRLGNYDQSKKLLERAITLRTIHNGKDHRETAASLDHLGLLLSDMGHYEAAITALRKSLSIREKLFRENHISIAHTQGLLAYALRRKGNYAKAQKLYKNSLSIQQKKLGTNHPRTIETKSSLAATLHNLGQYDETEKLYRQILKQRRQILGPFHPDVAMSINNLAALLMNTGQLQESEQLLKEALVLRKKLFGSIHPKVALTMNNLALVLRNQGKYEEAESLFNKVLSMRMQQMGAKSVSTGITQFCLAKLLLETDRPDSALAVYKKILPIFEEKLSPDHSFTVRTRMGMGDAYLAINNMPRAEQLLKNGFSTIQKIHDPQSLERALAESQMGRLWVRQNKYVQADSILNQSYNTLKIIEDESSLRQQQITALLNTIDKKRKW